MLLDHLAHQHHGRYSSTTTFTWLWAMDVALHRAIIRGKRQRVTYRARDGQWVIRDLRETS